tara:strand:- start:130 stop:393 length:264 start_codon:yes stop_codon:yes gene_type:complete
MTNATPVATASSLAFFILHARQFTHSRADPRRFLSDLPARVGLISQWGNIGCGNLSRFLGTASEDKRSTSNRCYGRHIHIHLAFLIV